MVVDIDIYLLHYSTSGDTELDESSANKSYSATAQNTQSQLSQGITEPLAPYPSPLPYLPTPRPHQAL